MEKGFWSLLRLWQHHAARAGQSPATALQRCLQWDVAQQRLL